MFERLATLRKTASQADVPEQFFEKICQLKIFDEQCFATGPNRKQFCLTSKFLMFDKQCVIVWSRSKACYSDEEEI